MAFTKVIRTRRSKVDGSQDSQYVETSLPFAVPTRPHIAKPVELITVRPIDDEIDSFPLRSIDQKIKPDDRTDGDETLGLEKKVVAVPSYRYCEAFWSVVAIVSYLMDMGSDIFVAYMYYSLGQWWYFGLTVGFAVASSLTVMTVSLTWYKQDSKLDSNRRPPSPSRGKWTVRIVLHVLQFGPVIRYFDAMCYGIRSRRGREKANDRDWYQEKVNEDTDASLLRLFECYLEAAPQLTLQLYILLVHGFSEPIHLAIGQGVCCVTSLTSIAWALTAYNAALRFSLNDKANMTNKSIVLMFFWRLLSVTARVLALSLFASMFHFYVAFIVGFHFVVTLTWLLSQDTRLCTSPSTEVVFVVVFAVLCTFDYFNVMEGRTRLRYLLFYSLVLVENVAMTFVFVFLEPSSVPRSIAVVYSIMALIVVLHAIAIATQMLYYLSFHPNNSGTDKCCSIQWVPLAELLKDCRCRRPMDGGKACSA